MVQIYKNGVTYNWSGSSFTVGEAINATHLTPSNQTYPDSISGDTSCLQLNAAVPSGTLASCVSVAFTASVPQDMSSYISTGHLQFDIRPVQTVNQLGIQFAYYNGSSSYFYSASYISSLPASASFTHVSIPLASFTGSGAFNINEPFSLAVCANAIGGAPAYFVDGADVAYIDDIKWTQN